MKPRFQVAQSSHLVARAQPLEEVVAWVRSQRPDPMPVSEYNHPIRSMHRINNDQQSVLRRQVLRAYGSMTAFRQVLGNLPQNRVEHLFKPWVAVCADGPDARLRAAFRIRGETR